MGKDTLLQVSDLTVHYDTPRGPVEAVSEVSLTVEAGRMTAVVGESGSGKSTTALAALGLLPRNASIVSGSVELMGSPTESLNNKQWRAMRGQTVGLIPQDPTNSLNPLKTVGAAVTEGLAIHKRGTRTQRYEKALELLERVGIDDPIRRFHQYPHELSGGMRQRVLIAAAVALEPQLLVADEPTSALDVTVQKTILDLLDEMREELGLGILFITHDLAVAGDRANVVTVMESGQVRERGSVTDVLSTPTHPYTQRLIADAPSLVAAETEDLRPVRDFSGIKPLVKVEGLTQKFGDFTAVDDVSFEVYPGTTHAIVGESGSGKTTTGRAIAAFHTPTAGSITIGDAPLENLNKKDIRELRKQVQMVYQNPYASLDPRFTIGQTIQEPLRNFGLKNQSVEELLELVSLDPALKDRKAVELSGGQRQRVAIARALAVEPELIILDEAVSALDVTVQSQILRLLDNLQKELGLTYIFISHDLAVVRQISDTVSVMQRGRQVESGHTAEVFNHPATDYTRTLIDAIPGQMYRDGWLNVGL